MQTLSRNDAESWCKRYSIPLDERGFPQRPSTARKFDIPVDSGKRVYLVSAEVQALAPESDTLVWFTEWSVWPSSERPHIFARFRASYGEGRPLTEAPAHLFIASEREDLLSFVTLGVLFLWDTYVVSPNGDMLHFSHDEYGWSTKQPAA